MVWIILRSPLKKVSSKSHNDLDDSNGLSIGVEQTIQNTQSPDLRYHWSISSIIFTVTIFHVYNRMMRTNSRNNDEAAPVRKGQSVHIFLVILMYVCYMNHSLYYICIIIIINIVGWLETSSFSSWSTMPRVVRIWSKK